MPSNLPRCTKGRECCWVEGQPCSHLAGDLCSLRRELGSWAKVHADARYQATPAPVWRRQGIADCGDYDCADCLPAQG